jgi:autotransporter-associated beta strand protein
LDLRGASSEANQLNAVLSNSTGTNTPVLNLQKADGGTWILNPAAANTFTGSITAAGGNLGLTANGIGAASGITLSNGAIFAFGGALTTAKPITLANRHLQRPAPHHDQRDRHQGGWCQRSDHQ